MTVAIQKRVTLDALVTEINAEHEAVEASFRAGLEHAVRCGELLTEAKAQVAHGEWGAWVEANCTLSDRTARNYMRVARELPKLAAENRQRVADLPYREAIKLLAAPREPRPVESAEDGWKPFHTIPVDRRRHLTTEYWDIMAGCTLIYDAAEWDIEHIAETVCQPEDMVLRVLYPQPRDPAADGIMREILGGSLPWFRSVIEHEVHACLYQLCGAAAAMAPREGFPETVPLLKHTQRRHRTIMENTTSVVDMIRSTPDNMTTALWCTAMWEPRHALGVDYADESMSETMLSYDRILERLREKEA